MKVMVDCSPIRAQSGAIDSPKYTQSQVSQPHLPSILSTLRGLYDSLCTLHIVGPLYSFISLKCFGTVALLWMQCVKDTDRLQKWHMLAQLDSCFQLQMNCLTCDSCYNDWNVALFMWERGISVILEGRWQTQVGFPPFKWIAIKF